MKGVLLAVLVLCLSAPPALASDPTRDLTCIDQSTCAGPGTCTFLGCIPRSCEPALYCRSDIEAGTACAVNVTIEGQTCQAVILGEGRTNTQGNGVGAAIVLTNGNVDAFNLPNTWISPSIEVFGDVDGVHTGEFSVGLYRSDIITPGPRGGPLGIVSPGRDHDWTHLALDVHHGDGALGSGEDIVVGVYLLDEMPNGCYERSTMLTLPSFDCPRPSSILP